MISTKGANWATTDCSIIYPFSKRLKLSKTLLATEKSIGTAAKLSYSKGRLKNFQAFPYLLTIFIMSGRLKMKFQRHLKPDSFLPTTSPAPFSS